MINYLLGVWQFALVWAVGIELEKRIQFNLAYSFRMALAFGLGEAAFSYLYFALGLVGGLRFWVLVPLAILGTVFFFPAFFRECRQMVRKAAPYIASSLLASFIILILLLIYALGAAVPEREVDSLWYHLAAPLRYIMNGGFIQLVPFNMPSHYPMNVHLHYTLSLVVGNDTTAKAFIFCHFFPLLLLLWSVTRRYASAQWGMIAIAIYLCCMHFRLPVMVNVQRAVYFHVFLSMALLWTALETRNRKLFWFAALFCGMAMGTKFNGVLFGYIGEWLLLLIWFFVLRKETFQTGFKLWVGHSAIAWLMMSPWLIKSWIYTQNPLYPMLGTVFPTKEHFVPAMLSNANNHGLNILKSDSLSEFLGQIGVNLNWLLYNADLIFFLGLLAVIVLHIYRKREWRLPVFSCTIAYGLFTLLWGSDIARLFAVNYGAVVLLITLMLSTIERHTSYGHWVTRLMLVCLFLTFAQQRYFYLRSPNINWFGQPALSETGREEWLTSREVVDRELFRMKEWMDQHVPQNEELYGYRTGYLFYLDRPYIVSGAHFGEPMQKWAEQGAEYIAEQLRELNVKWVMNNQTALEMASENEQKVWEEFRDRYLEEVHREGDYVLYRFSG